MLNFVQIRPRGASRQMGEINDRYIPVPFLVTRLQVRPHDRLQRCVFGGLEN